MKTNLITEQRAAEYLGVAPGTLRIWRCTGRVQLPFVRVGRSIRYRVEDVEQFVERRTVGAVAGQ